MTKGIIQNNRNLTVALMILFVIFLYALIGYTTITL